MQIESYSSPVPFTTVGNPTPEVKARASSPVVESVPLPSAKSTDASISFPHKDTAQLEKVTRQIQDAIQDTNISLTFSRDEASGAIVVTWIDQASGEAIQQFPSKVALRLAATLGKLQGQFLNHKA